MIEKTKATQMGSHMILDWESISKSLYKETKSAKASGISCSFGESFSVSYNRKAIRHLSSFQDVVCQYVPTIGGK